MAKTAVADIIVPTEFEKYAIERTAQLSAFVQSGIIEHAPEFDELAAGGGRTVEMPFWKDLTAARQILSDGASLAVNKITSDKDIARIQNDAQAWSVNHLAKVISGDDPMQAIVDLVGDYWARTDQTLVISALKGIFAAASMAGNKLTIAAEATGGVSATTQLNGATFVDATVKLGDRGDRLTAVAMHSATEAALRKLDLIDFIPDSEGKTQIKTFQGRRVVVDDTLPVRNGVTSGLVYTTYLFGPGAFGKGAAPLVKIVLNGSDNILLLAATS
jgi:N4-gp56 family major capsid protein